MKASELRLGNIIKSFNPDADHAIIDGINAFRVTGYNRDGYSKLSSWNIDYPELLPIQLTEEWLLKFGFDKDIFNDLMRNKGYNVYSKEWLKIIFEDGFAVPVRIYDNVSLNALGNRFLYVHQLQNLYFALTGEELILKS